MKKINLKRSILFFAAVLITVFLSFLSIPFGNKKAAAADYRIESYKSNLALERNKNESTFSQDITFSFNGEHNGVFVDQNSSDKSENGFSIQLAALSAYDYQSKKWNELSPLETNSSPQIWAVKGSDQTNYQNFPFYAQINSNNANASKQVKFFHKVYPGQKIRLRLIWRFNNLVAANTKIDELNWLPISNWQTDIHNFDMSIKLPAAAKELRAWVHTDRNQPGHISVNKKKGLIKIYSQNISAEKRLEVHSFWNKQVTNYPPLHKDDQRAAQIIKQERAITFRSNIMAGAALLRISILVPLIFIAAAYLLIKNNLRLKKDYRLAKQQSGVDRPAAFDFEIPNDLGPAIIANRLDPDGFDKSDLQKSRLISATFMDLIARKKISIKDSADIKSKNLIFALTNDDNLLPFESKLISIFFPDKKKDFQAKKLKSADSSINQRIRANLSAFLDLIKESSANKQIIEQNLSSQAKKSLNSAHSLFFCLIVLGSIFALTACFILQTLIAFILFGIYLTASIAVFLFFKKAPTLYYTEDGFQERYRWQGFEKMLKEIGKFDKKELSEVKIWDRILAYAVIFGQAKKVAQYLRSNLSEDQIKATSPLLFGFYYYPLWDIDSNISSQSVPSPTSGPGNWSGGGGGFSSGGGFSGGGGGGGGGAF